MTVVLAIARDGVGGGRGGGVRIGGGTKECTAPGLGQVKGRGWGVAAYFADAVAIDVAGREKFMSVQAHD
jgi:hypothetical protein